MKKVRLTKKYANNLFNMVFIQVKKSKHGSNISNKKLHFGINRKGNVTLQK